MLVSYKERLKVIKFIKPYFSFPDERGTIIGLIQEGNWKEINSVFSKKGTRRGDHYHKETNEIFIILEGKINLHLQKEEDKDRVLSVIVKQGDVFLIEPMVWHAFEVLEDSAWINMLDRVVKDDMYKVE